MQHRVRQQIVLSHCHISNIRSARFLILGLLCGLTLTAAAGYAQNQYVPIFPKYKVLGVVYAPPGSASFVTYGDSKMVGSSNSIITNRSNDSVHSTSYTSGFSLFGLGMQFTETSSDGWGTANTSSKSYSVETTSGNSVTTMGPVSSSLGVNHDNDIIYIWLNPVAVVALTKVTPPYELDWGGLQFNSCDTTDPGSPVNFMQLMNGCDPNMYPFPDIVGIPVWCLKNPYYPGRNCAQWAPFTSRSWDLNRWGTDSDGYPLGPGLTLQDYADILSADPFVTQTLVPENQTANFYCHPTYGVNVNPNADETILARPSSAPPSGMIFPDDYCGAPNSGSYLTMQRFDPYGTVQYPVPGPYGEPQTYNGTFAYTTTSTFGTSAASTHYHSQNNSTTTSFGFGASYGAIAAGAGQPWSVVLDLGFNFSMTASNGYSWSWSQTHNNSNTNQDTSSAAYSITGPQLSDNYTGPPVFDVYTDNVYGTFAFYSNLQRSYPKIEIEPIGVTSTSDFGTIPVGLTSERQDITLTNNSPYPMTMVAPAVTFSDPGFQIVPGTDECSNRVLGKYLDQEEPYTCTMSIQFQPVLSDAPNSLQTSYPIRAHLIAAGTENVSSWLNFLVTSTGVAVSGTAVPGSITTGATLHPTPIQNSAEPHTYQFATEMAGTPTLQTQVFTFRNYYSTPVLLSTSHAGSAFTLSDDVDYHVSDDLCSGTTVLSLSTCTITLRYLPVGAPGAQALNSKVTIFGTPEGFTQEIPLTFAGVSGPLTHIGISVDCCFSIPNIIVQNPGQSGSRSTTVTLTNSGSYPVVLGTHTATSGFYGSAGGTIQPGASINATVGFTYGGQGCGNENNCWYSGTVTFNGTAQTGGSGTPVSASTSGSVTVIFCPIGCGAPTQINIMGAEQSKTVIKPAKSGKGSITVGGAVNGAFSGTRQIMVTVDGFEALATYDETATSATVAKALAAAANSPGSPVTATVKGDVVTLKSVAAGASGNLAYTASANSDFTVSPSSGSLAGGTDEVTTVKYDGGIVSVGVNAVTAFTRWGRYSTPQTLAIALAKSLNSSANGAFTASVNDSKITIAPTSGNGLNVTTSAVDTKGFSPPSFAATTGK